MNNLVSPRNEGDVDPYVGDENTYQQHFRKTFITENQKDKDGAGISEESAWTLHDMMIPAGQISKLIRIPNPMSEDFRVSEVCDKLKITTSAPVIVLAGAMTQRAGKTLAGVARAAFRTDAVIIDSGIGSGIEKFALRKNMPLIGVAPEHEVIYPRISPVDKRDNELTNGHTHFMLIGERGAEATTTKKARPDQKYEWGQEADLKYKLAARIAHGRPTRKAQTTCRIVTVLCGDNPECYKDVQQSLQAGIPVIVLEGSEMSNAVIAAQKSGESSRQTPQQSELVGMLKSSNFFTCPNSSEDVASMVHLLLTIEIPSGK